MKEGNSSGALEDGLSRRTCLQPRRGGGGWVQEAPSSQRWQQGAGLPVRPWGATCNVLLPACSSHAASCWQMEGRAKFGALVCLQDNTGCCNLATLPPVPAARPQRLPGGLGPTTMSIKPECVLVSASSRTNAVSGAATQWWRGSSEGNICNRGGSSEPETTLGWPQGTTGKELWGAGRHSPSLKLCGDLPDSTLVDTIPCMVFPKVCSPYNYWCWGCVPHCSSITMRNTSVLFVKVSSLWFQPRISVYLLSCHPNQVASHAGPHRFDRLTGSSQVSGVNAAALLWATSPNETLGTGAWTLCYELLCRWSVLMALMAAWVPTAAFTSLSASLSLQGSEASSRDPDEIHPWHMSSWPGQMHSFWDSRQGQMKHRTPFACGLNDSWNNTCPSRVYLLWYFLPVLLRFAALLYYLSLLTGAYNTLSFGMSCVHSVLLILHCRSLL